ncbi:hypothetical protein [Bradyrhizobium sp. STM 3562]|uniref:hypothetical protein n=1 Tax=Bradyrhizobium sp. STM 3562 TaxID=578924 RepID=UPI00388E1F59
MFTRVVGAIALTFSLSSVSSVAVAGNQHGIMQRMSCSVVRFYVAKYSESTAEMWARSHGATDAQIEAARRCLRDTPERTAEAARWYTR